MLDRCAITIRFASLSPSYCPHSEIKMIDAKKVEMGHLLIRSLSSRQTKPAATLGFIVTLVSCDRVSCLILSHTGRVVACKSLYWIGMLYHSELVRI